MTYCKRCGMDSADPDTCEWCHQQMHQVEPAAEPADVDQPEEGARLGDYRPPLYRPGQAAAAPRQRTPAQEVLAAAGVGAGISVLISLMAVLRGWMGAAMLVVAGIKGTLISLGLVLIGPGLLMGALVGMAVSPGIDWVVVSTVFPGLKEGPFFSGLMFLSGLQGAVVGAAIGRFFARE